MKENKEKNRVAEAIVNNFLYHEIKTNFSFITKPEYLDHFELDFPSTNYLYGVPNMNFSEFDKVKYELLKYQSKDVKDALEIYEVFNILVRYANVQINGDKLLSMDKRYLL